MKNVKDSFLKHWRQLLHANKRLKTHQTFFSKSEELLNKYNIVNTNRQPLCLRESFPPTLSISPSVLSINLRDKKSDALRAYALEAIFTKYSRDNWLHIYTDGSAQEDCITGAGFYCEGLFEGSCAVGLNNTNFEAEIEALRQASLRLADLKTAYRHAVFLVDSQAAILSLCSLHNSDSVCVGETRKKI
ncbi:hypothetical protein AVEN_63787-1 [Araneus ventricosus]|uniref:RNase H type-1 domain-containing protein n=1 Tax=Araneus ventricosus TaxID=182803 RepID=A0A4Y2GZX7_ARAVE|nr:hypothetical protein AVEN_63787-1 [Araneus ventricosus]